MKSLDVLGLSLFSIFMGVELNAQVGIGTTDPKAQLDIRSSSQTSPSRSDGILIPQINNFPGVTPQDGLMVYATGLGTPLKGFYYWNAAPAKWLPVGANKIDDLLDGKSDSGGSSIFLGSNAGNNDDQSDNRNVGMGFNSMNINSTGDRNTAVGYFSLSGNGSGSHNTANGYRALQSNIGGVSNTGIGSESLLTNTTGRFNTALGSQSLRSNTGGIYNTANGFEALNKNVDGGENTAVGVRALYNNIGGDYNTALGTLALYSLTTGGSGNNNTAVGYEALSQLTAGTNNMAIGFNAQVPNSIGSNQIRMGDTLITLAQVQVPWTSSSDRRWKDKIHMLSYGLNMVLQLKPVDYIRQNNTSKTREIGFIAQDVEVLLEKLGYTDQGLLTADEKGFLSLRYNDFIPILVKAVQEQQVLIENLQKENEKYLLKSVETDDKNKELGNRLEKLEALLIPDSFVKDDQ